MGIVLELLSKTSVLLGSGWVVVLAEDQLPSKMSKYTCFRQWLGGGAGKGDQPPLKTSVIAHFWQWLGGGGGKGPIAIENARFRPCHCCCRELMFPLHIKNISEKGG